ncbi:vlc [Trypoxylus dichotomus]
MYKLDILDRMDKTDEGSKLNDLPEDRSSVLLLGVTRIPTSPTPARRPCSLPLAAPPTDSRPPLSASRRRSCSSSRKRNAASRSSTLKQTKPETSIPCVVISPSHITDSRDTAGNAIGSSSQQGTPSNSDSNGDSPSTVMDQSVDSIGTCSLDVEASVESSGRWCLHSVFLVDLLLLA